MRAVLTTGLQLLVLAITLALLFQAIERGGWWIAALVAWLPVNALTVAIFHDCPGGSDAVDGALLGGDADSGSDG